MPIAQMIATGYSSFGQGTPKQVSVSNSLSTVLLSANGQRFYAQINNNSNQVIWISKGIPAVVGKGTRLSPGNMYALEDNGLFLGQLNAITQGSGPANIDVEEGVY